MKLHVFILLFIYSLCLSNMHLKHIHFPVPLYPPCALAMPIPQYNKIRKRKEKRKKEKSHHGSCSVTQ